MNVWKGCIQRTSVPVLAATDGMNGQNRLVGRIDKSNRPKSHTAVGRIYFHSTTLPNSRSIFVGGMVGPHLVICTSSKELEVKTISFHTTNIGLGTSGSHLRRTRMLDVFDSLNVA